MKMISHKFVVIAIVVMMVHPDVKVHQNKIPGKPDAAPPKRIRHPGIHVCVIRRRRIISHNRGPLVLVICVFLLLVRVIRDRFVTRDLP
jgi:hypothetical protein